MTKSFCGSLMRPRSRQSTFKPAAASSMLMMEPTTPLPTTTASTGFILVVVTLFAPALFIQFHVSRKALRVQFDLQLLHVDDADGLCAIGRRIAEMVAVLAGRYSR